LCPIKAAARRDPQVARRDARKEVLEPGLREPKSMCADIRRRLSETLADQWQVNPHSPDDILVSSAQPAILV